MNPVNGRWSGHCGGAAGCCKIRVTLITHAALSTRRE
jgi:hypothetical protein